MGIFSKINFGLGKTRNKMAGAIDEMLDAFDSFEDDLFVELEEILVMSDVGVNTAVQVVEELRSRVKSEKLKSTADVKKELQNIIAELIDGGEDMGLVTIPSVILVIGVNGAGKTTSIGKMAAMYKAQGKKVILGAADTFRAAAIDQLDVWAQRAGVDIIKHKEGADPAAVVYDTIQAGIARDCDIIICDTAGRLHNKKNLMDELGKIYRVCDKELPYADREVLLVLDATTGQNAVNQAREFMNVAELTGIVLTKLDGTARGGVVLSIKNDLKLPVKFIGVGEGIDDLQPFSPSAFAKSLFETASEKDMNQEGDTLSELVNSEDYINYTPKEDEEDGSEALKELFTQVFGEIAENVGEAEGDSEGSASAGPQNSYSEEIGEEGTEENTLADEENTEIVSEEASESGEESIAEIEDDEEQKRAEALRLEAEKAEAERLAREKAEAERLAAEKAEAERLEAEKAEAERLAREKAEAERLAAEKAEAERLAREKAEAERLAREKAEAERLAREKAEAERLAREKAEEESKKKKRGGLFGFFNRHS